MSATLRIRPVNRPKRGNRFCGPAVLSALTGMTTDDASRVFRSITGKPSTMGTSVAAMLGSLKACGILARPAPRTENSPTLAAWLRDTVAVRKPGVVFLVEAGNHWQLVEGRRYVCGIVGDVVSIRDERVKRRARVRAAWQLIPATGGVVIPAERIARVAPKPRDTEAERARREAHRIGEWFGAEESNLD